MKVFVYKQTILSHGQVLDDYLDEKLQCYKSLVPTGTRWVGGLVLLEESHHDVTLHDNPPGIL